MESANDAAIAAMQERAKALRQVTVEIHEEVEAHHRLLDGMSDSMESTRGSLRGVMARFKAALEHKGNHGLGTAAACVAMLFLLFRLLI